jgi:hypothetical protein
MTSYVCIDQGCQMVYFQTKNPNLGKFWRALESKRLTYSMDHLEYVYYCHLVYFTAIW